MRRFYSPSLTAFFVSSSKTQYFVMLLNWKSRLSPSRTTSASSSDDHQNDIAQGRDGFRYGHNDVLLSNQTSSSKRSFRSLRNVSRTPSTLTTLYSLIEMKQWEEALDRLIIYPAEAREWYIKRNSDGTIKDKFLPIMAACRKAGSVPNYDYSNCQDAEYFENLIRGLVQTWPESTKMTDMNKMNALHWACWSRASLNVIHILLGARNDSASKTDSYGRLPLHIACEYGTSDEAVVSLLRKHNSNGVNVKDLRGRTPVDIAEERKNPVVTAILKRDSLAKRRHTETTTRTSITSSELSNLPEFDRLAKRASERARKNSLPQGIVNDKRGSFIDAIDAVVLVDKEQLNSENDEALNMKSFEQLPSPSWQVTSSDDTSKSFYETIKRPDPPRRSSELIGLETLEGYEVGVTSEVDKIDFEENREKGYVNSHGGAEPTPLAQFIIGRNWNAALARLKSNPGEAEKWRTLQEEDGSVRWKLPIHDACYRQPPLKLVQKLVDAYRVGLGCQDDLKKLPIHWACEFGASEEVVDYLLTMNPLSIFEKDVYEQIPVNCANKSEYPNKEVIITCLLMEVIEGQHESSDHIQKISEGCDVRALSHFQSSSERTLKAGNEINRIPGRESTSLASLESNGSEIMKRTGGESGSPFNSINTPHDLRTSTESLPYIKRHLSKLLQKSKSFDSRTNEAAVQLDPNTPTPVFSADLDVERDEVTEIRVRGRSRGSRSSFWSRTLYALRSSLTSVRASRVDIPISLPKPTPKTDVSMDEDDSVGIDEQSLNARQYPYAAKAVLVDDSRTLLCFGKKGAMIIGLSVIACTLALSALLISREHSQDEPLDETSTSISPTLSPTLHFAIESRGVFQSISGEEAFLNDSSSQSHAHDWMIKEDKIANTLDIDDFRLVQRYVAAVFYFSLNGTSWINNLNWLNETEDECNWNKNVDYERQGIVCVDGKITQIRISKFSIYLLSFYSNLKF